MRIGDAQNELIEKGTTVLEGVNYRKLPAQKGPYWPDMQTRSSLEFTSTDRCRCALLSWAPALRGTIDALRAEYVGVTDLQKLFGSEGFRRTKNHVSRVVDDDIETVVFIDDSLDGPVG